MFKVHLVNLKNKIRTGCVRDLRHKVKRERDIPEILIIRGDNNVEEVISQNSYDECFNYECDIIRDDSDDENDSIRGYLTPRLVALDSDADRSTDNARTSLGCRRATGSGFWRDRDR